MLFPSTEFLGFIILLVAAHYFARTSRSQNLLLLLASYAFYAAWDWRFLSLILASTLIDYFVAPRIQQAKRLATKKRWLLVSIGFNLGMLATFKYLDFGIESMAALLEGIGLQANLSTLELVLPVGISFYTFQTMSYTIDVYRGRLQPIREPLNFALFVVFFPQLVAGPIERARNLLPQFALTRHPTRDDWRVGLMWIATGYFLKVAIADNLAPHVDHAFADPTGVGGAGAFIAVWGFALQIYGDFAGYSLIARGIARIFGIHLMANFHAPYLSSNPREFWTRWHISLSTWLREYLYFSLGGNRKGPSRTYVNLMLTMLLGGLWHGAAWNFVLWGAYQGALLCVAQGLNLSSRLSTRWDWQRALGVTVTFVLMLGGWLLFRATDTDHIALMLGTIFSAWHWTSSLALLLQVTAAASLIVLTHDLLLEKRGHEALADLSKPTRIALMTGMAACVYVTGFSAEPFLYFQF